MNSKNTISITEARKRIFQIADEVQKPGVYYTLTENGRPKAAVISAEEFDSLIENLEIMSSPELLQDFKEAEKDYKKGKYTAWKDVKKEISLPTHIK